MNILHLLNLPALLDVQSVVCVQPHPDDNEVGAAGTHQILTQKNCMIIFVTVTNGHRETSLSYPDSEHLISIHPNERIRTGEIFGVTKQIELAFPDGEHYSEEDVVPHLLHISSVNSTLNWS